MFRNRVDVACLTHADADRIVTSTDSKPFARIRATIAPSHVRMSFLALNGSSRRGGPGNEPGPDLYLNSWLRPASLPADCRFYSPGVQWATSLVSEITPNATNRIFRLTHRKNRW